MLTAALSSSLTWNLIVICLVGITAIIIIQIVKYALLRSLNTAAESNSPSSSNKITTKILDQKIKVKQVAKILCSITTAATVITLLVFILFMNNSKVKKVSEVDKIKQAPLPKNFKPMSNKAIKAINEKVSTAKSIKLQKQATEENTKAMNNAIDIFKKSK